MLIFQCFLEDGGIGGSYNYFWKNFLWERSGNWVQRISTTRDNKDRDGRGRETVLLKKNHTLASVHHGQQRSQKYKGFPGGARDLSSTLGTSAPRYRTREMRPPNTWLWKPMGNIPRKTIELQWKENLLLKGPHMDSLIQKPAQKQQTEKSIVHW